jgi:hypothetical protein
MTADCELEHNGIGGQLIVEHFADSSAAPRSPDLLQSLLEIDLDGPVADRANRYVFVRMMITV